MITLKADGDHIATLKALMSENIGVRGLKTASDGFTFGVRQKDFAKAVAILGRICYNYQIIGNDERDFFKKLLLRLPLVVTSVVCAIAVFLSGLFVWRVNIDGANESLSLMIKKVVSEYGVYAGNAKTRVDEAGALRALYSLPDVAAVSFYYSGNTFNIDVLTGENSGVPLTGEERIYSGHDCVITRVDAEKGTALVGAGDVVRAGEALITGETFSTADGSLLFTGEARGKVYGNVTFTYICYASENTFLRTGRSESYTALGLFGHTSSLGESPYERYETVTERHKLLFGAEVITRTYYELESLTADDETEKFISEQAEKLYELYGETFAARASVGADGRTVVYFTAEICVGEA